jgi:hypothetical protein
MTTFKHIRIQDDRRSPVHPCPKVQQNAPQWVCPDYSNHIDHGCQSRRYKSTPRQGTRQVVKGFITYLRIRVSQGIVLRCVIGPAIA